MLSAVQRPVPCSLTWPDWLHNTMLCFWQCRASARRSRLITLGSSARFLSRSEARCPTAVCLPLLRRQKLICRQRATAETHLPAERRLSRARLTGGQRPEVAAALLALIRHSAKRARAGGQDLQASRARLTGPQWHRARSSCVESHAASRAPGELKMSSTVSARPASTASSCKLNKQFEKEEALLACSRAPA